MTTQCAWPCIFRFLWTDCRQCLTCVVFHVCAASACLIFIFLWTEAKESKTEEVWLYWVVHGAGQWVAWGMCITTGCIVATVMQSKPWWLQTHQTLQLFATMATIPAIMTAWLTTKPSVMHAYTHVSHAAVGLVIAVMAQVQSTMGVLMTGGPAVPYTRLKLVRWWKPSAWWSRHLREWHRVMGKIIWLLAMCQLLFGIWTFIHIGFPTLKQHCRDAGGLEEECGKKYYIPPSFWTVGLTAWSSWLILAGTTCYFMHRRCNVQAETVARTIPLVPPNYFASDRHFLRNAQTQTAQQTEASNDVGARP